MLAMFSNIQKKWIILVSVVVAVLLFIHSPLQMSLLTGLGHITYNTHTQFHTCKITAYEFDLYKIQVLYLPYDDIYHLKLLYWEVGLSL
jgi:hypothetical protein